MNKQILNQLASITDEEKEILKGNDKVNKNLYTQNNDDIIDYRKFMDSEKLIQVRPHTRFVHFPKHKHNYIEVIYMYQGTTTHIIDNEKIVLSEGELLFLNQHAEQEILPAGEDDIGVNFIIVPEFFSVGINMLDQEVNVLRDFLISCLFNENTGITNLHFKVSDVLPIQNLVENLSWSILNNQAKKRRINQITMGLLFLQLVNYADRIENSQTKSVEGITINILKYIEENYKSGTLTELSDNLGYNIYWLSKVIKKQTGFTFKELLQSKRLRQTTFLLINTTMTISDIGNYVGYDNISYFHRIFKKKYSMSPKEYRDLNKNRQ